ncbi:S-adenosyl-L-homocysteine hydrolase [Cognatishimia sp. MH4019]|uniref:S-adenosyl-L-homocysteine hydrolase n=1 Tax=Cognatishimia sp. MH4019 TaxID=2854030 RepID=UPI001CD7D0DC|nr:S-adenosyl-L-homocysteine hydrolase [Cognatishimia sp. MH4019]
MKIKALAAFVVASLLPISAAAACMPRAEMASALIDWYGEEPVDMAMGVETDDTQLWASDRTGTWTLVRYTEDSVACVVAQGFNFEPDAPSAALVAALETQ